MKTISFFLSLLLFPVLLQAQHTNGSIAGKVIDHLSGDIIPFADVIARRNGVLINGAHTDFDGKFFIGQLEPGVYEIETNYSGYYPGRISQVIVKSNQITLVDFKQVQSDSKAPANLENNKPVSQNDKRLERVTPLSVKPIPYSRNTNYFMADVAASYRQLQESRLIENSQGLDARFENRETAIADALDLPYYPRSVNNIVKAKPSK